MRLSLKVPARMTRDEALRRALDAGVRMFDLSGCYSDPAKAPNQLCMGFTALTIPRLIEAAERIAGAWKA
jgi:DNA-binding transcriptional MocR family regulator